MATLSYHSEPQIKFLTQLVRDIGEGTIQLPRFQRPYVWTEDQQLELFRSILTGTPIGTIMLWRTDQVAMKSYDMLGAYRLQAPSGSTRTYIIDGHQRLATLFTALHVPPPGTALPRQVAYYDLEAEDFLLTEADQAQPCWLPLRFVPDFDSLLPFQRSLMGHEQADVLLKRMDRVVKAFAQYKVPVVTVTTNDIDAVTRTFQRINSQGTVMSEVHMISALTWTEDFDLNERVADIKEEELAPRGWGDLDSDVILRACKMALGLQSYEQDVDQVSQKLRDAKDVFEEVALALISAIEILKDSCGVHSPKVLPYPSHIVVVIEALRREPARAFGERRDILTKWFWAMAYCTIRLSPAKLLAELVARESGATSEHPISLWIGERLDPLPPVFNFRRPRCRTLALRLAQIAGGDAAAMLGAYGADAMPNLLYGYMRIRQDLFVSPANRILVAPEQAPEERRQIREACERRLRTEHDRAVLGRHAISEEAATAYARRDFDRFFSLRTEILQELESSFVRSLGQFSE